METRVNKKTGKKQVKKWKISSFSILPNGDHAGPLVDSPAYDTRDECVEVCRTRNKRWHDPERVLTEYDQTHVYWPVPVWVTLPKSE